MIQRIQSIFLLLAFVAIASLRFGHAVTISGSGGEAGLFLDSVRYISDGSEILSTWPLAFLVAVILAMNLLVIFMYKRRPLQMRLCIYSLILMAGLLVLGYYYTIQAQNELGGSSQLEFYSIMPIIGMILNFLAWRAIRKDDLMLKAIDRIR